MSPFAEYLTTRNYSSRSVRLYTSCISRFEAWCEADGLPYELLDYADLLGFIKSIGHYSRGYQNQHLTALRLYFSYLKSVSRMSHNPAAGLYLRKEKRRAPHELLTQSQLESLYASYEAATPAAQQKKLMLSLVIFQALRREELEILTPDQLELRKGQIRIPATRRANARILKLQAHQVLDLASFLKDIRPTLFPTPKLFTSPHGSPRLSNTLTGLLRQLKTLDPKVKSLRQLRQSVIREWLRSGELREVQYRAGHKYVSSTERYRFAELEALQKRLNKFHPLG